MTGNIADNKPLTEEPFAPLEDSIVILGELMTVFHTGNLTDGTINAALNYLENILENATKTPVYPSNVTQI